MNTFYKEETQKKRRYVIVLLLLIILALIGALFWMNYRHQNRLDKDQVGIIQGKENSVDYATIPGFKTLTMTADTKEQEVYFQNPTDNNVNLQLRLHMLTDNSDESIHEYTASMTFNIASRWN